MDNAPQHLKTEDGVIVRKIYVSNVPSKITKSELQTLFEQFGKVQNVFIKKSTTTNGFSGKVVSFAFVTFYEAESATKALNYPQTIIFKYKKLKLKPADTWHQPVEQSDGSIKFDNGEVVQNSSSVPGKSSSEVNEQLNDDCLLGAVGGYNPNIDSVNQKCNTPSDECHIKILNDDCLMHIFSYLSLYDHLILEKVCQSWGNVVQVCWNRNTVLDIDKIIKNKEHGSSSYTTDMLRKLLLRCGANLKNIKLTNTTHNLNSRTHRVIAQCCRNVEILDLSGIPSNGNSILFIARNCNNLRKIYFKDVSGVQDNVFDELFSKNLNLESVNLDRNFAMSGKCLRHLTSGLKELRLDHCNSLKLVDLKSGFKKFTSLEVLSLDSCVTLTTNVLTEIVKTLPNLKSLSLDNYYPLMHNQSLRPIQYLKQLKNLSLSMNQAVNNTILELICLSCHELEVLDISGSGLDDSRNEENELLNVTGFIHISKLPKLRELTLNYMEIVCEESVRCLAAKGILQILRVRGCPFFDDKTAQQLLQHCQHLTYLDMSGCEKITGLTIINAISALKLLPNRKSKLKFEVGGTSINLEVAEQYPLLEISSANLSLSHLRPDFFDDYFPSDDEEYDLDDFDQVMHDEYFGVEDPNEDYEDEYVNWRQFIDILSDCSDSSDDEYFLFC